MHARPAADRSPLASLNCATDRSARTGQNALGLRGLSHIVVRYNLHAGTTHVAWPRPRISAFGIGFTVVWLSADVTFGSSVPPWGSGPHVVSETAAIPYMRMEMVRSALASHAVEIRCSFIRSLR